MFSLIKEQLAATNGSTEDNTEQYEEAIRKARELMNKFEELSKSIGISQEELSAVAQEYESKHPQVLAQVREMFEKRERILQQDIEGITSRIGIKERYKELYERRSRIYC